MCALCIFHLQQVEEREKKSWVDGKIYLYNERLMRAEHAPRITSYNYVVDDLLYYYYFVVVVGGARGGGGK